MTFLEELIDLIQENEGSMFTLKVSDTTTFGQKSSEIGSNFENILSTSTPSFPRDLTKTKDNESSGITLAIGKSWVKFSVLFPCFSEQSREKSIFSVLQQMYIPVTRPAPAPKTQAGENISWGSNNISPRISENNSHYPSSPSDTETYEGSKLEQVLRESAAIIKSEPVSDSFSDEERESDPDTSLLIPLLSLSIIILITLALSSFRIFYTKFYKDKEEGLSR